MEVRPLDAETWPNFARLVEEHGGVWGGCWCMAFLHNGTLAMFEAQGFTRVRPLGRHHWVVSKVV